MLLQNDYWSCRFHKEIDLLSKSTRTTSNASPIDKSFLAVYVRVKGLSLRKIGLYLPSELCKVIRAGPDLSDYRWGEGGVGCPSPALTSLTCCRVGSNEASDVMMIVHSSAQGSAPSRARAVDIAHWVAYPSFLMPHEILSPLPASIAVAIRSKTGAQSPFAK